MSEPNFPSPEELQRRLQEFLRTGLAKPDSVASAEDAPSATPGRSAGEVIGGFQLRPKDLKRHLDRFVIRQDEAKKVLSIAVCDHYNHARQALEAPSPLEYAKQNVLLVGPTGVGKTYLVRHIAELIGVPFVKADATKFSETGYVGGDVDDLVRELVDKADGDLELAGYGIVYIDEIDKIATAAGSGGRDVSGRGVQTSLLKLMEETEVPTRAPNDIQGQIQAAMEIQRGGKPRRETLNTRHVLFIVSGAFDKLADRVALRLKSANIGFGAASQPVSVEEPAALLRAASTSDFVDFGMEPEFIGRLPVRVVCDALSESDLFEILRSSEGSLLRQYERAFRAYGIEASFDESAMRWIARQAADENTGARGLLTVCERSLRDLKFELPDSGVRVLPVTERTLAHPASALADLIEAGKDERCLAARRDAESFAKAFSETHGLGFEFEPATLDRIVSLCVERDESATSLCTAVFKDYQFGLGLIRKNSGRTAFLIPPEAIEAPDRILSQWVVASYRAGDSTESTN